MLAPTEFWLELKTSTGHDGRLALSRAGILSSWWHGCGEDEATALRRLTTIIAIQALSAWDASP